MKFLETLINGFSIGEEKNKIKEYEQLCAEAIEKHPDRLMEIMPKAYTKLSLSK